MRTVASSIRRRMAEVFEGQAGFGEARVVAAVGTDVTVSASIVIRLWTDQIAMASPPDAAAAAYSPPKALDCDDITINILYRLPHNENVITIQQYQPTRSATTAIAE